MRMIAADADNDLYVLAGGNLAISSGLQACLQACAHAVKAQFGEMVQFEASLRGALLAVKDVTGVPELTVGAAGHVLVYTAVIRTVYGEGALNG